MLQLEYMTHEENLGAIKRNPSILSVGQSKYFAAISCFKDAALSANTAPCFSTE